MRYTSQFSCSNRAHFFINILSRAKQFLYICMNELLSRVPSRPFTPAELESFRLSHRIAGTIKMLTRIFVDFSNAFGHIHCPFLEQLSIDLSIARICWTPNKGKAPCNEPTDAMVLELASLFIAEICVMVRLCACVFVAIVTSPPQTNLNVQDFCFSHAIVHVDLPVPSLILYLPICLSVYLSLFVYCNRSSVCHHFLFMRLLCFPVYKQNNIEYISVWILTCVHLWI